MDRFAYVVDGIVAEVIEPLQGFTIEQRFAPDFVSMLVQCSDDVQQGWLYDGKDFSKPADPATP